MKGTVVIDGVRGRIEMNVDTDGMFKEVDGDVKVLKELVAQAKAAYQQLNGEKKDE